MNIYYYSIKLKLSLIMLILFMDVTNAMADDAQFIIKGNSSKTYTDLNEADKVCSNGGVIVLTNNGTLKAGNYTISKGHTLLIPFDSDNTLCGSSVAKEITPDNGYKALKAYRTLTLEKGTNIDVWGDISVGGQQYATSNAMSETVGGPGTPSGDCGVINMKNGGSITLENGSNLYVWGFIIGQNKSEGNNTVGVGIITAKFGSKVYENFVIGDYRGGNATIGLVSNKERVFPFNQYTIPNIEIPLTLEFGASEITSGNAYTNAVKIGSWVIRKATTNPFNLSLISNSGSLFTMANGSTVKKWYDPQTDEQCYETTGNLSINSVNISISGAGLTSSDYVLPLTSSMSVNIKNGTVTIPYDIALIPGSELIVGKDATLAITSAKNKNADLYVYDVKDWGQYAYSGYYWKPYNFRLTDHLTHNGKSTNGLTSAKLEVNGTLNVNGGNIYTTSAGGNICCNEAGRIYFQNKPNASSTTTQLLKVSDKTTVNVTAAQLHNANGTYQSTTEAPAGITYYYVANNNVSGAWKTTRFGYDADNSQLFLGVNDPLTADSVSTAKNKLATVLSVDLSKATGTFDAPSMRTAIGATDNNNILLYAPSNVAKANNVIVGGSAENIVITDKQPIKVPTAFTAKNVTYTRQNTKNGGDIQWGTICLPFAVKSGNGVQYYKLENINGSTMNFTKVDEVEANQPAIYSIASDTEALSISDTNAAIAASADNPVSVSFDGNTVQLVGVQNTPKTLDVGNTSYYYISQNKFWQPTKNAVTVSPQRAYFVATGSNGLAKSFSIAVSDSDTPTAIDAPETTATTIIAIYSVNGARQNTLQKGINIVKMSDGSTRKIVVR